ncbi:acyltransferase [Intrasporangium calvum]|uniref:Acyltransferase n=1 Tax=Intrasporangium calvum TaxID=53358 RepID=A0ABT5GF65_9MICO|nr:acyltransferase family protein [Intrasporangium calvum]MDC5696752.1 acyltransferase [Intrasporangium calvum]
MTSAATKPRNTMRGDIEGLRSIAVLFVLIYHLGVDRLSGGFAGVDVFFVISGFLITSGLLTEAERSGTVSLLRFYARRARRLLPAATVVLVVTALVGWQVMPKSQWSDLSTDVIAAALYVVNWALAFRAVDYLAEDAAVSPVQHYWSLSVEEQFYVVIPVMMLVLAWVARRFGFSIRRIITIALAVIVAVSLIYSIRHTDSAPQTAYFYSTTRAWELGIGSLLACAVPLLKRMADRTALLVAAAGLALVIGSGLVISTKTPWPGSAALFPTIGTAAVIAAGVANPLTPVGRLLSIRPMVWIGGLSYSIYLWHWPLIILSGYVVDLTRWHKVLIAVASVGLAWLSKHLIEDPIRFGPLFARRTAPTLAMGAAGMALSLVAASVVYAQAPRLEQRPSEARGAVALGPPEENGSAAATPDLTSQITRSGKLYPEPALAPQDIPAYYADECQVQVGVTDFDPSCVYGDPNGSITVALTGDSKMGQWFDVINAVAKDQGWRLELYLKSTCGLNPEQPAEDCRAFNVKVMDWLTSPEGKVDIMMTSAGRGYASKLDAYVAGYDAYWKRLEAVGTRVVAVSDTPGAGSPPRYECAEENPDDLLECAFRASDGQGTAALREAAQLDRERVWLDLNPWVCPEIGGKCPVAVGGVLIYRQGSHVTKTYADTMRPIIEDLLAKRGLLTR